jgi:hypothetical protein
MRWKRARALAAVALGTGVLSWMLAACLSPTLPLPPPSEPETAVISSDLRTVTFAGRANPNAFVMIFNDYETVQAGAIVMADDQGKYAGAVVPIDLSQNICNPFQIWQRMGTEDSAAYTFEVGFNCRHQILRPPDGGLDGGPSTEGDANDGGVE